MSDGSFQVQHDDDEVRGLSTDRLDYSYEEYLEWQHLQGLSQQRELHTAYINDFLGTLERMYAASPNTDGK